MHERLTKEINHWDNQAAQLQLKLDAGKTPAVNVVNARNRAEELASRLKLRKEQLSQERTLKALPPRVAGAAMVLPGGMFAPASATIDLAARREVEQRAVAAVLAAEDAAGWDAEDMNDVQRNHPGYDVRSIRRGSEAEPGSVRFIEVKGRIAGSTTVTVSRNEILTSLNEPENWVLALVEVKPDGGEELRYLFNPFESQRDGMGFGVTSVTFDWNRLWEEGRQH